MMLMIRSEDKHESVPVVVARTTADRVKLKDEEISSRNRCCSSPSWWFDKAVLDDSMISSDITFA